MRASCLFLICVVQTENAEKTRWRANKNRLQWKNRCRRCVGQTYWNDETILLHLTQIVYVLLQTILTHPGKLIVHKHFVAIFLFSFESTTYRNWFGPAWDQWWLNDLQVFGYFSVVTGIPFVDRLLSTKYFSFIHSSSNSQRLLHLYNMSLFLAMINERPVISIASELLPTFFLSYLTFSIHIRISLNKQNNSDEIFETVSLFFH